MKYEIPVKKAGEFALPALGLGTWGMGGENFPDSRHDESDMAAIRTAIESGITHIDTAEMYARGHSEEVVGEAVEGIPRGKLFITSKVMAEHLRYDDVLSAAEGSLKRLKLDYLDLYLVHWPSDSIPLEETMRAMAKLKKDGFIRNIGVSNFHAELLKEAQEKCEYRIVNNQINYSLAARAYEEDGTLEYCEEHKILVTAYSPLKRIHQGRKILSKLGEKYQKPPMAVALNWVVNKPNIVALVKTSDPRHLEEDLGAIGWRLDAADERDLDENFPRGTTRE